jgi:hypothetical protein
VVSLWIQDGTAEGSNFILLYQFWLAISRDSAHWDFDPVWTGGSHGGDYSAGGELAQ